MVNGSRDDNSVKRGMFPSSQGSISLAYFNIIVAEFFKRLFRFQCKEWYYFNTVDCLF
jgi:hypothetical protein